MTSAKTVMEVSNAPIVTFEELDPADLASALGSLKRLHRQVVIQTKVGIGYEIFLRWALRDVEEAERASSSDESERTSVNAIMNARRALSCLVDQYLLRDGFLFCQRPPSEAGEKAAVLIRRGVFDSLASQSLKKAIERRNDVEHKYKSINLSDAQDIVHVVRATVENAVARSSPYESPGLFGTILGGFRAPAGKPDGWFNGWSGSAFIIVSTVQPAWAGVIVPTDQRQAVVRKVDVGNLSVEQLLEALSIAESLLADQGSRSCSPNLWHAQLTSAGLLS